MDLHKGRSILEKSGARNQHVYEAGLDLNLLECILEYTEDLLVPEPHKITIVSKLYMARKLIAQKWLQDRSTSVREHIDKVDWLVGMETFVYTERGNQKKFETLWA